MAGAVRQPLDTVSLSAYLGQHVPSLALPFDIKQFGYGQSNPTYLLIASDASKYVLRKKPPGRLLSRTAHRIDREFRIIRALETTAVPVPKTYCLCEDVDVIGTAFYVMEYLDGRIFDDPSFPTVSAQERHEMWRNAVRVLASLHQVLPDTVGLANFGAPSAFYERQLRTLSAVSEAQAHTLDVATAKAVGPIPHFDDIVKFLQQAENHPPDRSTLVHGDFKIDNLVFHKEKTDVIGILDWEMSTIGHPLSDLCNLLSPYSFAVNPPNDAMRNTTNKAFQPQRGLPGLPSQEQCLTWYAEVAGWDTSDDLDWGMIFGAFRNGVIVQGIAARYARRQASSEKAQRMGGLMFPYGEFIWGLIERRKGQQTRLRSAKL